MSKKCCLNTLAFSRTRPKAGIINNLQMKTIFETGDVVCRAIFAEATENAKEDSKAVIRGEIYATILGIKSEQENVLLESVMVIYDRKERRYLATYIGEVDCDPAKFDFPKVDGYRMTITDEDRLTLPFAAIWERMQARRSTPSEVDHASFSRYGRELEDAVELAADKMQYRETEFVDCNILGVKVGTTGHLWNNGGHYTYEIMSGGRKRVTPCIYE